MKTLLFIMLAGYAVRCEENSYYVIEVPEQPLRSSKSFKVYWNVPTMQCASKNIPFKNLYEKFGIIQNDDDRFKGEKITIMYDPGLFPALFKNESSGKFKFRNGGVPQEGNLDRHLMKFKEDLDESIPDENYSGVGIIDFESWRPVFRQNFGTLQPYKDVSFEIERTLHPWWSKASIEAEARSRFTSSGRSFMEATLALARSRRPRALWGFYGFPYCFNMAANNMYESCARKVPEENDEVPWLWSKSTALFPSVYSHSTLSTTQLASLIRGRIKEAARHRRDHILPYLWFRYRDGGFLSQKDVNMALSTIFNSAATGIIIWGSSKDVDTVLKCNKLYDYIENIFGPAVAKYTKNRRFNNEVDKINEIFNTTFPVVTENPIFDDNSNFTIKLEVLDPEFHFAPPENYTEEIKKHVEKEISMKLKQNTTEKPIPHNNAFIDFLLNYVINTSLDKNKDDKKTLPNLDFSTTEINMKLDETSQVTNPVTNSPFFSDITDKSMNIFDTTTKGIKYEISTKTSSNSEIDRNTSEFEVKNTDFETKTTTVEPQYEDLHYTKDAYDNFNYDTFQEYTTINNDYLIETSTKQGEYDKINPDYDKLTTKGVLRDLDEIFTTGNNLEYYNSSPEYLSSNGYTTESEISDDYFETFEENEMIDYSKDRLETEISTEFPKIKYYSKNAENRSEVLFKNLQENIFNGALWKLMKLFEKSKNTQEETLDTTNDGIFEVPEFLDLNVTEDLKTTNKTDKTQSSIISIDNMTNSLNLETKNEDSDIMTYTTTEQVDL